MRRGPRSRWARVLALAGLLVWAPPARADGTADEAEIHFRVGAEQFSRGDFNGALIHFLTSNRLVPNRNVVFNIATTYEQLKRFPDAYRYYVDALEGETDPRAIKDLRAAITKITPHVAVLEVTTQPPGATVYIERKDLGSRGKAPRRLALPPGKYRVIAELEGYDPATSEPVDVRQGSEARVSLDLARIVGTVHVDDGGRKGIAVHVDDPDTPPACVAPCDLKLPPGRHELHFTQEGHQPTSRQVTVVARETTRAVATLTALTGSLTVTADERDALVTIDGRAMGTTPAVIPNVPAARHKVRVSLPGYAPVEREVVVQANEQTQLAVELVPSRQVTAVSRYAERIEDAPSSVSIIDGQELRAFGYPTIAEALRGVRGVYLNNDRSYWSIGIRGLGQPNDYGNRVLVLSDGQPLNDNLLNSSYVGSDGRADLHDVDRIEVVRGPGSLLYGAGAFSGVVNLVTRPRDEPNGVHVAVGSYDDAVIRARAGFHYNFTPNAGVWASVSAAHSHGIGVDVPLKDPGGGPAAPTASSVDAFNSVGTAGRAWYGPVTLQWFFHTRDQIIPVGAYDTVFNDPRTHFHDTRMMAELRYEPKIGKYVEVMARVHANRYTFHGGYVFGDGSTNVEDYHGTWFGAEARVVVTPIKELRLTAGGEGQLHPQATLVGDNVGASATTSYLDESSPYRFAAAYAIAEASPLSWLRAQAGARVDVYSTFGPIVVPRAAIIFKPPSGTVLKIMGGQAFRAPSIYEQVYNDGGMSQVRSVDGTHQLGPERISSGELEISQRFKEDWVALIAGHASVVEGRIQSASTTGCVPPPPGQEASCTHYDNSPSASLAVGGDVEVRREWRRGWMLGAMYGYQRIQSLDPKLQDPRVISAPEHLASLRGVAPVVRGLVSLAVRATLEAPRRIRADSEELTRPGAIVDVAASGSIRELGLRYTAGIYNVAGWRSQVPVTETFLSRTIPQNGRTFLFDLMGNYP
jgi:outer membrane receptor for ferrienterochelin and colicin